MYGSTASGSLVSWSKESANILTEAVVALRKINTLKQAHTLLHTVRCVKVFLVLGTRFGKLRQFL